MTAATGSTADNTIHLNMYVKILFMILYRTKFFSLARKYLQCLASGKAARMNLTQRNVYNLLQYRS